MKTAVSAPGKVFLAGGYLVLDRQYTALVFGLSARIHIVVEDIDTTPGVELSEIIVESPQFRDALWRYGYHLREDDGGIEVTQLHEYALFSSVVSFLFPGHRSRDDLHNTAFPLFESFQFPSSTRDRDKANPASR